MYQVCLVEEKKKLSTANADFLDHRVCYHVLGILLYSDFWLAFHGRIFFMRRWKVQRNEHLALRFLRYMFCCNSEYYRCSNLGHL